MNENALHRILIRNCTAFSFPLPQAPQIENSVEKKQDSVLHNGSKEFQIAASLIFPNYTLPIYDDYPLWIDLENISRNFDGSYNCSLKHFRNCIIQSVSGRHIREKPSYSTKGGNNVSIENILHENSKDNNVLWRKLQQYASQLKYPSTLNLTNSQRHEFQPRNSIHRHKHLANSTALENFISQLIKDKYINSTDIDRRLRKELYTLESSKPKAAINVLGNFALLGERARQRVRNKCAYIIRMVRNEQAKLDDEEEKAKLVCGSSNIQRI